MKKPRHLCQSILSVLLILVLMFSLVGCGNDSETTASDTESQMETFSETTADDTESQMEPSSAAKAKTIWFYVASYSDPASVTEQGGITRFTAVGRDGTTIHFEGIGVTLEDGCIVMQPGAKLFSLDYVGQLTEFTIQSDTPECWIDFGFAFANKPFVESMTDLRAAHPFGLHAGEKTMVDLSMYDTGFFVLSADSSNTEALVINELTLMFDTTVPQTVLSELDPDGEVSGLLKEFAIDWADRVNLETTISADGLAQQKLEDPNVLRSDIISGIDQSSVVKKGSTIFFSATMSDGTVVRFEGTNIEISEDGITIHPGGVVTSLDAVGKIYAYFPLAENREGYNYETTFDVGYGYTYTASKTSVERAEEVHTYSMLGMHVEFLNGKTMLSTAAVDPNFIYFSGPNSNTDSFVLSGLEVCYNPSEKVTAMVDATLNAEFASSYIEGERYDASVERSADLANQALAFYLILKPDTEIANMADSGRSIYYVPKEFYHVGALRDADGNELDKTNATVSVGCTLDLTLGDSFIQMPLTVLERYTGAQTMNDLVPYAYPEALGQLNTLVVPVIWADQTHMANDDTLQLFREGIGRIVDESGEVTDYSVTTDKKFSLSEYYDIASYGKMNITSFMTDWYYSEENFADIWETAPDDIYANDIMDWVRETYPDLDWSKYDRDGNGYVDSMVILNAGVPESNSLPIISYSGAINYRHSYYGDHAGTQDAPRVNTYTTVGYGWIQDDYSTIIHEFAHGLGLIDYYDVYYSGIDAVGSFDMQSGSYGDWNAYSKYAVGWMDPQIVYGLASGESVEYTIGSSALTDDVILIPAAGAEFDGPFGEYVMIDLFTDDGVNEYDADKFGMADVAGVRISHVNAGMEKRTMEVDSVTNPGESAEYTIGTIHIANEYKAAATGKYNIEVIQAGGDNTFTDVKNLDTMLEADDLFYAGDTFTVEDYEEFFYEGLMDDGSAFGYVVEIIRVGTDANGDPSATIRITAK